MDLRHGKVFEPEFTTLKEKVWAILQDCLGKDTTGIYTTYSCQEGYTDMEFYSNLLEDNSDYGDPVYEPMGMQLSAGASRIAIIPDHEEFVIKLPIMYICDTDVCLQKDGNEIHTMESDCEVYQYKTEGYTEVNRRVVILSYPCEDGNLMEKENNFYEEASSELKEVLLPNIYIGDYCGIPIYIQKKATSKRFLNPSSDLDSINLRRKFQMATGSKLPSEFIITIIDTFGFNNAAALAEEIEFLGITDIHGGNVATLEDGFPVIFDYAGYEFDEIWMNF